MKDKITNICGLLLALSGAVLTMQQSGVVLPPAVITASMAVGAIAAALIAYFTGKSHDGKKVDK